MSVEFDDTVPESKHDDIRAFLTGDKIDEDLDVRVAAKSTKDGTYVKVTEDWHPDKQGDHLTVEVHIDRKRLYTAHVYANGQLTAFS